MNTGSGDSERGRQRNKIRIKRREEEEEGIGQLDVAGAEALLPSLLRHDEGALDGADLGEERLQLKRGVRQRRGLSISSLPQSIFSSSSPSCTLLSEDSYGSSLLSSSPDLDRPSSLHPSLHLPLLIFISFSSFPLLLL